MKRKTIILSALLAVFSVVSCQREEAGVPTETKSIGEIGFLASVSGTSGSDTKSIEAKDSEGETYKFFLTDESMPSPEASTKGSLAENVYGSMDAAGYSFTGAWAGNGESLFYKAQAYETNSETDEYRLSSAKYWLANGDLNYKFYAVSPSGVDYVTWNGQQTSAPVISVDISGMESEDVTDILVGKSEDLPSNYDAAVPMTFKHIFAAVRIEADAFPECVVQSAEFRRIRTKGNYSLDSDSWTYIGGDNYNIASVYENMESGNDIVTGDKTFLLVPQTFGEESYLRINYVSNGAEASMYYYLEGITFEAGHLYTIKASQGYIEYDTDGTDVPLMMAFTDGSKVSAGTATGTECRLTGLSSVPQALTWEIGKHITRVDFTNWGPGRNSGLYGGCARLGIEEIDLTGISGAGGISMQGFLQECRNLKNLDTSPMKGMDKVQNLSSFALNTLDLETVDLSGLADMTDCRNLSWFLSCSGNLLSSQGHYSELKAVDLSPLAGMTKVEYLNGFLRFRSHLTEIDLSPLAGMTENRSLAWFLASCSGIAGAGNTIDISPLAGMTKVTSLAAFLMACQLTEIDLSPLAGMTDVVTVEYFMGSNRITSIDLSFAESWTKVTSINSFLANCFYLTGVDLSPFKNCTIKSMFNFMTGCVAIENVDMSMLGKWKPEAIRNIFNSCYKLKTIDLSAIDFSNATHYISEDSYGTDYDSYTKWGSGIFQKCSALEYADISNIDFSEDGVGQMCLARNATNDRETGELKYVFTFQRSFYDTAKLTTVVTHLLKESHLAALKECLEKTHADKTVSYIIDEEAGTATFSIL